MKKILLNILGPKGFAIIRSIVVWFNGIRIKNLIRQFSGEHMESASTIVSLDIMILRSFPWMKRKSLRSVFRQMQIR